MDIEYNKKRVFSLQDHILRIKIIDFMNYIYKTNNLIDRNYMYIEKIIFKRFNQRSRSLDFCLKTKQLIT